MIYPVPINPCLNPFAELIQDGVPFRVDCPNCDKGVLGHLVESYAENISWDLRAIVRYPCSCQLSATAYIRRRWEGIDIEWGYHMPRGDLQIIVDQKSSDIIRRLSNQYRLPYSTLLLAFDYLGVAAYPERLPLLEMLCAENAVEMIATAAHDMGDLLNRLEG